MCDQQVNAGKISDDSFDAEFYNTIIEQANDVITEQEGPSHPEAPATARADSSLCSQEDQIKCALRYGPQAIDNKIIVSISENINIMATAITKSEDEKSKAREHYIDFFRDLLVYLLIFSGALIITDTFFGIHVRTEFLVSVLVAIIADVFAIVHTLVKYTTNVEHYSAYSKLIDSLLKHITRSNRFNNHDTSDHEDQ